MTFRTAEGRSIHRATRTHEEHVDQFTFYIYRDFAKTEYIISLYFLSVHLVLSLFCVYIIFAYRTGMFVRCYQCGMK